MSGSGSVQLSAYLATKNKIAKKAQKLDIKKKYKNYWCIFI